MIRNAPPGVVSKQEIEDQLSKIRKEHGNLLSRKFPKSKDDSVRFLQFNILAEGKDSCFSFLCLTLSGLSSAPGYGNFTKTPRKALDFEGFRKYRILEEMLRHKADIMAIEEMDHFFDFFEPALKHYGYNGAFLPKNGSPTLAFGKFVRLEVDSPTYVNRGR